MMAARGDASPVLRRRLDGLAADVGRLRRHLDAESYGGFLAWRIAEQVDALDALLGPTAAQLVNALTDSGVDTDPAVHGALKMVDGRCRELRGLLGEKAQ